MVFQTKKKRAGYNFFYLEHDVLLSFSSYSRTNLTKKFSYELFWVLLALHFKFCNHTQIVCYLVFYTFPKHTQFECDTHTNLFKCSISSTNVLKTLKKDNNYWRGITFGFFYFAQKLRFFPTQTCFCVETLPCIFSAGLRIPFVTKTSAENSAFPGGVIWRSFVKQETKKDFAFMNNEIKMKTSLHANKWQFLSKMKKKS